MTSYTRAGLGLAAVAAIVAVVWRCRGVDDDASPTESSAPSAGAAGTPALPRPARWLAQTGITGRRIAGVVVDEKGTPMVGVPVRLASPITMAGLAPEPRVATDAAGRFDLGPHPATDYIVAADQKQRTGAVARVDLRDTTASPAPDQLRLVLYPCDASIHGTIRDTAGGTVRGAMVVRQLAQLATSSGAESDDNGAYELCVPPGGASVIVRADGYAAITDYVDVFGRTRRDFSLGPGAAVVGRVVRAGDRAPVSDAIVELRETERSDDRNGFVKLTAASDADGKFHFDGVKPGRHEIVARAERLVSQRPIEVAAEIGRSDEITCEVVASVSVAGKVVERGSKTPIAGLRITLASPKMWVIGAREAITQTDGSFAIENLLAGEYRAFIGNRRMSAELPAVTVGTTDVTGLVLEVDRRGSIAGRVLLDGKPVDGARVHNHGSAAAVSDADGRYVLRDLEAGTYSIYAESNRLGAFTDGPSVTIAAGEDRANVDVVIDLAGSIAGVLVDQNDAPVAGAFLSFSLLHKRDFGRVTTADDGSFTVRGLSGGGDYVYEVRERDGAPLTFPPASGKRFPPISVRDGATHVTGVRIQVRVERFTIAGRVLDASGKPVPDATVRAIPGFERYYRIPTGVSDQRGAFVIRDLPAGTYAVDASTAHGDVRVEGIAAGRTDVTLRLQEPGGIDATVGDMSDSVEVVAYRGDARYRAVANGTTFQFRNLTPGDYMVVATNDHESITEGATVASNAITKVAIRRPQVGAIAGTVVDENGRPVADMHCTAYARSETNYQRPPHAVSDANGMFRIERAVVGTSQIMCSADERGGSGRVEVTVGDTAHVAITASPRKREGGGHLGLTLETQFGTQLVKSVETNGPAARAGILVGDIVRAINDQPMQEWSGYQLDARALPVGTQIKLALERNDKELVVTVTAEASP